MQHITPTELNYQSKQKSNIDVLSNEGGNNDVLTM